MSILNITNLTDNPESWIRDKYLNAFEEVSKELRVPIDETQRDEFIDSEIEDLKERADETMGKDLLGLIDNYLVNLDYYSEVKWYYENK
jgi:hypothetical protein